MFEITSPITGERLQVAQNDFESSMKWHNAKQACKDLGINWRLPTKSELEVIYEELHKDGKGNFKNYPYWSNTESGDSNAWDIDFSNGGSTGSYGCSKDYSRYVRAVRPL